MPQSQLKKPFMHNEPMKFGVPSRFSAYGDVEQRSEQRKKPSSSKQTKQVRANTFTIDVFFPPCTRKFSHVSIVLLNRHIRETLGSYASEF